MIKHVSAIGILTFIIFLQGCSADTAPGGIQPGDVAAGVVAGGAVGAMVGAFSSGIDVPVTTAMGGIIGGAIATAIDLNKSANTLLMDKLARDHVQVIRMGEDYMLVLPSHIFFYPNSTHMSERMLPAYHDITAFINLFDVETVKVAGYTNNVGDPIRNVALSRQQAQIVASQLIHAGAKPTMIYSIGYGDAYPIAYNTTAEGRMVNNRVQITFRQLTPKS